MVQSRIAGQRTAKSTCWTMWKKAESEGGRRSSNTKAALSTLWWRIAKRSKSLRIWQQLKISSTVTSSRYLAGLRTPRRMRASGIGKVVYQIEIGFDRNALEHREGAIPPTSSVADSSNKSPWDRPYTQRK
jgi:hypothetical protein